MDFRTILSNDTDTFISECGTPTLDQYEYALDDKGRKILKKTKTPDNVYEKIQSFKEETDINNIMARFALGDETALNVNKGYYIDASSLPSNIFEVYQSGLKAEQYFDSLPVDLKEQFDNSYVEFMISDEKDFFDKVSKYNKKFENNQFNVPDDDKKITDENTNKGVIYNE